MRSSDVLDCYRHSKNGAVRELFVKRNSTTFLLISTHTHTEREREREREEEREVESRAGGHTVVRR